MAVHVPTAAAAPGAAQPAPARAAPQPAPPLLPGLPSRREAGGAQPGPALPGVPCRQAPGPQPGGPALPGVPCRQAPAQRAPVAYVTSTVTTPKAWGAGPPAQPPGFLPKWARSGVSMDLASIQSSVFSLHSSSALPLHADSKESFRWAPERVVIQSWHQRLSETYKNYNMVNMIGEGRHGAVFIVQHRTSEKYYACKLLFKRDHEPHALRSEIDMLRRLDHPNIVRLIETNEDAEAVFLLMELCRGGDLFGRVAEEGRLPEPTARAFAWQMFKALAYCHAMGVAHHDVKPENFLLETEEPSCLMLKLADFGIATSVRPSKLASTAASESEVRGSIPYMAPERFMRRWDSLVMDSSTSGKSLIAGDAWSSGVVLYVMLSGDLPFGENPAAICSGRPPDFSGEVWRTVSGEAMDLIRCLLCPEVEGRWTAQQALGHPWFGEGAGPDAGGAAPGAARPAERQELARVVVEGLRRWRQLPKLRRIAAAAVAKRLEAEDPALCLARAVYGALDAGRGRLRCEELVRGLNAELCEAPGLDAAPGGAGGAGPGPGEPPAAEEEPPGAPGAPRTRTGLHVRRAVRGVVGRLLRPAEDAPGAPGPGPLGPLGPLGPGPGEAPGGDLVSLTELRCLVGALDGAKNGVVDFTLLVAALLPPEAFSDAQLAEAFGTFDIQKRGRVSAEDLMTYMSAAVSSKEASIKRFSEMIAEFDLNEDGALDLDEFRAMLQGPTCGSTPVTSPGPFAVGSPNLGCTDPAASG